MDPTSSVPTSDPSEATTLPPTPECQESQDCSEVYCGYCVEGRCESSYGCCDEPDSQWRCGTPGYECYSDADCPPSYACSVGECVAGPPIPLPACRPPDLEVTQWNLSGTPGVLLLLDLDLDLDLDLVATRGLDSVIEVAFNDGAGNFTLGGALTVGDGSPLAIAAGDLDGDGDPDLAAAGFSTDGTLSLLFNEGAVFTVGAELPSNNPRQVVLADFNGDAALDVATVHEGKVAVAMRLGDGKGGFTDEQPSITDPISGFVVAVDLSGDGIVDLLTPRAEGLFVRAWVGQGDGSFVAERDFLLEDMAGTILAADLDLEGSQDVVFVERLDEVAVVRVWTGAGPLQWGEHPGRFQSSLRISAGLLAEIDTSPGPDLLAASGVDGVVLLPGDGQGGFLCEQILEVPGPSAPELLAVGDVDGDGRPDIVAGSGSAPTITMMMLK